MEDHLISKKDLLLRYGISYGALYRWKRMGLIPEDWFIKKATVTGQETFFDEKTVCERIERILNRKDTSSLEELAKTLSGVKTEPTLVVTTPYGVRRFRREELLSARIEGEESRDVTAELLSLFEGKDNTL